MRITRNFGRAAAAISGALVLLGTGTAAQAAASDRAPAGNDSCVIVVAPLEPGQTTSRVLSRLCADSPRLAEQRSAAATGALASTLLLVLYDDIRYGGASTQLRGSGGPCDTAGYGFGDLGSWKNRVSSFKRYNWCQRVAGYDTVNYGGSPNPLGVWTKDTDWVGATANDRIESILTRRL